MGCLKWSRGGSGGDWPGAGTKTLWGTTRMAGLAKRGNGAFLFTVPWPAPAPPQAPPATVSDPGGGGAASRHLAFTCERLTR